MPRGFTLEEVKARNTAPVYAPPGTMVPVYETMSNRREEFLRSQGLSTIPKLTGYSVDLGNGQFANYDANKNFLGNVSDNKGGFATQFLQNHGEDLLNAGLIAGSAALLGGANLGATGTAASIAPEVLAADLAVYPTAGIVGAIPEAAGIANTIALPGAAIAGEAGALPGATAVGEGFAGPISATSTVVPEAGALPGATAVGGGDAVASGALEGGGSGIKSVLTSGSAPGSELAATTGEIGSTGAAGLESLPAYDTYVPPEKIAAPTAAERIAAATTSGGTLPTALGNEAVASGMAPGSLGAEAAASGVLTDAQLAAATGAGGIGALTGADAAAANLTKSANEAVASGTAPGSAGAALGAAGTLTDAQLNAANGVTTGGISALDAAKKLLNAKNLMKFLGIGAGAAAIGGALNKSGPDNSAYQGTIPEYTASRTQYPVSETRPSVGGTPYRPGQGGITYFSPMTYTPKAASGGLMSLAGGGMPQEYNLGSYSDGGRLLKGPGDGVSDSIPAIIGKKQPARLATGEFVVPARIVSELGNGSTEAGAKRLYEMMDRIQKTRRKTKNVAANTNAAKYLPA